MNVLKNLYNGNLAPIEEVIPPDADYRTMKLLKCEQEVHISFCADEENATIYTSYPAWIRKMDKLVEKNPQSFRCIAENEVSKTYSMPRNFISIRSKERTVTLTEEQKAQAIKRLHGTE